MPLLLLSIFLGIMGLYVGSALLGEPGLILGGVVGFFVPSIVILWSVYKKVCSSEPDEEIVVNNDEDDTEEKDNLIGDEWKI